MSDSVQPHRRQPTRLRRPWDSPGKNTGVDCHFLLQCVKVKLLSCIGVLATPWAAAYQAPLYMGFSRQEYWSGVPLPSPINWLSRIFFPNTGLRRRRPRPGGEEDSRNLTKMWSSLCHQVLTDCRLTHEVMVTKNAGKAINCCEFS